MFNWVDYAIFGIIFLSMILGLMRGFVREVVSLAVWVIAFWIAAYFAKDVMPHLGGIVTHPAFAFATAFLLLLLATLFIGMLFNYFIGHLVKSSELSGTDRMLGLVFGFLRGVVLVIALLLLTQMFSQPLPAWWQQSAIITKCWPWLSQILPIIAPNTIMTR